MRRSFLFIGATITVGCLAFFLARELTRAQTGSWTPFTAVMATREYYPNATKPYKTENSIYAVRADGSWSNTIIRQFGADWYRLRVVQELALHEMVTIDPVTKSTITYPLTGPMINRLEVPKAACTTNSNALHESILGFDVVEVKRIIPGPPGEAATLDEWDAPQLNCFALSRTFSAGAANSAPYTTTRTAISVAVDPVDGTLFDIPNDYTERSPSQVFAELSKRFPSDSTSVPSTTTNMLDGVYQGYRARH